MSDAGALRAQLRIVAALHDAEQRAAGRRALEGALAALGPGERQPHGAIEFGLRRRQLQAFVELHGDVGAEQMLDFDRALGRKLDLAPSRWERKVTPLSSTLRSCDSDMTWKPPESVRIARGQFMNWCRPPSAAMRSAPGRSIR